ncbi:hypothetical protein D9757_005659 [Collybiopsis confluens]|uniref:Uncharacterized protein n=1 Tax=Collybiopsis confluens TaxID=2823264 RepID=A0A8H5MCC6_9AGAR|nr:hypothetical protein D9757_005659 [Collybiopsis confluens]
MASQLSSSSDDPTFELALAEQLLVSKEKKKKEKQRKFLLAGRKLASKETDSATAMFSGAVQSIDELFQAFTINYAAEDDSIRALWSTISEEQSKLQKLSKRYRLAVLKAGEECEHKQIKGMGKAKESVLDAQKVIELIYPKPIAMEALKL